MPATANVDLATKPLRQQRSAVTGQRLVRSAAIACVLALAGAARALGEEAGAGGIPPASIATSLPADGDPFDIRRRLAGRGIIYTLTYTNDILTNVRGGLRRGTIDQGKLEKTVTVDLEKAAGLAGLSLYANAFEIHNSGRIRRDYVGGINTVAAIEAVPAQRLSELWLERKLLDGKASLRVGQLAADVELFFSDLSAMFLQSDWPTIAAANLPSGGPAYPLSTPGVRLKYEPVPAATLLLAVFNGDPAGPGEGDEQLRNRHGLSFRVRDPALAIAEAQLRHNRGKEDTGLSSIVKLGVWGHFGRFDDKRLGDDGRPLADPASHGAAARREGNAGTYAVVEQQLWRPTGGDAESGVSVFARLSASPSDRNLVDVYVDGGVVLAGLVPGRKDDKLGASFIYTRLSDGIRALDRDRVALDMVPGPIRDFEANLELTYVAQLVPGWTVQPVATRVWHPSGGGTPDAFVAGVRSFWRY